MDGNGYSVYGLSIIPSVNYGYFGLLGINNGTIKNLVLVNMVMEILTVMNPDDSPISAGAFAGKNYGIIQNCKTIGVGYFTYSYAYNVYAYMGGIAGYNSNLISLCENNLSLTGYCHIGGIAGFNSGTVSDCKNNGEVCYTPYSINKLEDNKSAGGIVGIQKLNGKVQSCISNGNVICGSHSYSPYNDKLMPHMGQVIGYMESGSYSSNAISCTVDTSWLYTSIQCDQRRVCRQPRDRPLRKLNQNVNC